MVKTATVDPDGWWIKDGSNGGRGWMVPKQTGGEDGMERARRLLRVAREAINQALDALRDMDENLPGAEGYDLWELSLADLETVRNRVQKLERWI